MVSVIIPLYNSQRYISETIESVINQTYTNWELIVVDDCSTDTSREIVKEFEKKDSRIRLVESQVNFGGPARPRNIGIEHTKGEFIAFLDSDDMWLKDKLEKQIDFLREYDYDIIHTSALTIDVDGNNIGHLNNQRVHDRLHLLFDDLTILSLSNYININTVLMKKDINIKFREDKNLIALEDWLFWIENLFDGKKFYYLAEELIKYRIDMNSISARGTDKSYKKAFYMYALLLNEKKISYMLFLICSIINRLKIVGRRIKRKLNK
ncbi:glycosyltransferase [bacterium]|nr:glycosyltransferase [bacterium]